MNEHELRRILEGGGGFPGAALRALLWLPGKLYGTVMAIRRACYERGILPSGSAPVPVIAIGNLTAGGSGKTPFTAMLAAGLLADGRRPGILLRGYRRSGDGLSDEAVLYESLCPGALVETGADRLASAERATSRGADVLLMDDGFQHLRLRRNLDIVLVDAASPWGGGNCFPGGLLREPKRALARAGIVVVTRTDQQPSAFAAALREEIARLAPDAEVFSARHAPARLRTLAGRDIDFAELRDRPVIALSGIARPESFHRTLADLGARLVDAVARRDHDHFDPGVLAGARSRAERLGAMIVTTEKDMTKQIFRDLADKESVWVLGIEQEVDDPKRLRGAIEGCLKKP